MAKVTLKVAKERLAGNGMNIRRVTETGEYRVSFKNRQDAEASAYYTDDIDDAIMTGLAMSTHAKG